MAYHFGMVEFKRESRNCNYRMHITYFPRILILTFRDLSPSRDMISQALFFSGGHAKSSQLRVAPLKGDNF
jgi:hypothetical protein